MQLPLAFEVRDIEGYKRVLFISSVSSIKDMGNYSVIFMNAAEDVIETKESYNSLFERIFEEKSRG